MKELSEIRSGTRILLHTSILLYARWGVSPECRALIKRCQGKAIRGVITPFTLADFCERRLRQEATSGFIPSDETVENRPQSPPSGPIVYSTMAPMYDRPDIVRNLTVYADDTRALLSGELELTSVHPEDFLEALSLQKMHGLVTTDSLNLAIARRLGINEIATASSKFDTIPGLIVYTPVDSLRGRSYP